MANMHVGDYGTIIEFTIKDQDDAIVDISNNVSLKVDITRPSKPPEVLDKVGALVTDGTDGKMRYIIQDGDFTVKGNYKFQAIVTLPDGRWHTDSFTRKVKDNLDPEED